MIKRYNKCSPDYMEINTMKHIPPSMFIPYSNPTKLVICKVCSTTCQAELNDPIYNCVFCGSSWRAKSAELGTWKGLSVWYNPFTWFEGSWQVWNRVKVNRS